MLQFLLPFKVVQPTDQAHMKTLNLYAVWLANSDRSQEN